MSTSESVYAMNRAHQEKQKAEAAAILPVRKDELAPAIAKAKLTLRAFAPVSAKAVKLAETCSRLQDMPPAVENLIMRIMAQVYSVPSRLNAAIAEYDNLTVDQLLPSYRGDSTMAHLGAQLSAGDVCFALRRLMAQLEETVEDHRRVRAAGSDTTTTVTPTQPEPPTVRVNTDYSPLRK